MEKNSFSISRTSRSLPEVDDYLGLGQTRHKPNKGEWPNYFAKTVHLTAISHQGKRTTMNEFTPIEDLIDLMDVD